MTSFHCFAFNGFFQKRHDLDPTEIAGSPERSVAILARGLRDKYAESTFDSDVVHPTALYQLSALVSTMEASWVPPIFDGFFNVCWCKYMDTVIFEGIPLLRKVHGLGW